MDNKLLARHAKATKRHAGEGSAWQCTLPNGEIHTYGMVGVRTHAEAMDSAENLIKWIWDSKDYLKKLAESVGEKGAKIEEYVNQNIFLSVCADLANGLKHGGLDKSRKSRSQMPIEDIISEGLLARLRCSQETVTRWIAIDRAKLKHIESTCEAISEGGDEFQIYVRQSQLLVDNFSCGIKWKSPDGVWVTLARYNGSSHTHENKSDGQKIVNACHVHQITVEAVLQAWDHENYATATDLYSDLDGAKRALSADFSIIGFIPDAEQLEIWKN